MSKLRLFFLICFVLLAGGTVWHYFFSLSDSFDHAKKTLEETAQNAVLDGVEPEEVAALAVKAIEMTQGEHGIELWRLKAEWGNVRREGELLELEKPRFVYHMPPDDASLQVVSEQGEVHQAAKIIRFIRSVNVTWGHNTLHSSLMVYNGTLKALLFPEGTRFAGRGVSGAAADAVWRLDDRVIDASGGVDMTWEQNVDPLDGSAARALSPAAP